MTEYRTEPGSVVRLVREHTEDRHPLLDCVGCPVCEWMLAQHAQSEKPA